MAEYSLTPVEVPQIETKYRSIKTAIPVPESLSFFERLRKSEPRSMSGQPPVIWHSAQDCQVADRYGNKWIDWSSGVLITNCGHAHPRIEKKLHEIIDQHLLASYVFVHEGRVELTEMLQSLSPDPDNYTVFLLSTGSEATENCIKMAKTYALKKYGPKRKYFVTFSSAFHGRTMGSQLAGGWPVQKEWIIDGDRTFIQVPFPDGFRNEKPSFQQFLDTLKAHNVEPEEIAGVMSESYQGGGPDFMPIEYAQELEKFCRKYDIILAMDEVQAGFGRSGKFFTFQHYGITPDLIPCGKGVSSSLPLSAVIGRRDIMDLYAPGSMTSTHSASPLCVAAALENLKIIKEEKLVENAAAMGEILQPEIRRIQQKYADRMTWAGGRGLVGGIRCTKGDKQPDPETSLKINLECLYRGLLMFAPVGNGGECVKIAPPLTIKEDMLRESIAVLEEACDAVFAK